MCLAMPAQVVKILDAEKAIVNLGGIQKEISTLLVNDIAEGDYVILHVGFALTKLNEFEAIKTLQLFDDIKSKGLT